MKFKYTIIILSVAGLCSLFGCRSSSGSHGGEMSSQGTETTEPDSSEGLLLSEAELQALYEEYVENKTADTRYKNGKWGYYDVNQDGADELVLTAESGQLCIVQNQYGELKVLYEDNYSTLLENGTIRYYRFGGGQQYEQYVFYTLTNGKYTEAAVMNRYDTAEDEYRIFDENDRYEIDRGTGSVDITMEEWMDALEEYLEYPKAEIAFQSMAGEDGNLLAFATETEAYQAFLNGECGVVLSDSYTDDIQYLAPCLTEGEVYTLYDILNCLSNESWRYEIEAKNYGTDIAYAYVDCGQDGRKELALKIGKTTTDAFETIYIIQYRDNQLYLCYGIDRWSRRHALLNQYGYIWEDGSGGASLHSGMDVMVDGEGVSHRIWKWMIDFDYPYYLYFDYPAADLINETGKTWRENYNNSDVHPLEGLSIQMSVIDDKDYYTYDFSPDRANVENMESFIESCEAAGVPFSSASELAAALQARREALVAAASAEDKNEVVWTRGVLTFSEGE